MEREKNIGTSNYSELKIQPWDVWEAWNLNPWDADIVKRVARTKVNCSKTIRQKIKDIPYINPELIDEIIEDDWINSRIEDYEKIIQVCHERIRQLKKENNG